MDPRDGICTVCREWTTTDDSCCGGGVWVDGHTYYATDDDESMEGETE